MYGLVNQAIQGLVTENFGQEAWAKIKNRAGITQDIFIGSEMYPDETTYHLAAAAAEELKMTLTEVLRAFGRYWILNIAEKKYHSMMESGGTSFSEFLINLPNFHSRVMLMYADIKPPEFRIDQISETKLHLHYFSTRQGLTEFVHGLVMGLAELFKQKIELNCIQQQFTDNEHDIFEINLL